LERQVQEGVADSSQSERTRRDQQRAELRVPNRCEFRLACLRSAFRRRTARNGLEPAVQHTSSTFDGSVFVRDLYEQDKDSEANDRDTETGQEHQVELPRKERQDPERNDGPDHGACGVEGAMDSEGCRQTIGHCAQRDQRVARRGTYALSHPVSRHHRGERRPSCTDQQQAQLGYCRNRVSNNRN
jgi:hypothetical protein